MADADSSSKAENKATQKQKVGALASKIKVNVNSAPAATTDVKPKGKGKGKGRRRRGNKPSFMNSSPPGSKTKKHHLKSEAFKKACRITLMNPAGKWKQLSFGTSELWSWMAIRSRTALGVASQYGKLRTNFQYLVLADYCSFFAKQAIHRLQSEIYYQDLGSDRRDELPEVNKTDLRSLEERLRVTNVNSSFPVVFTGSLSLDTKGYTLFAPNYAADACGAPWPHGDRGVLDDADLHTGIFQLRIEDMVVWRHNLHPNEATLAITLWDMELNRDTVEPLLGTWDVIVQFIVEMFWPAPYNNSQDAWQLARWRGIHENVIQLMQKWNPSNRTQVERATQGGVSTVIKDQLANWSRRNFGAAANPIRYIDEAVNALTGDRKLTQVRMQHLKNYPSLFDSSLFVFGTMPLLDQGKRERSGFTIHAEDQCVESIIETVCVAPMRIFPENGLPEDVLWQRCTKFSTFANNELQAAILAANFEVIREEMQKYIRDVYPVDREMPDDAIEPDLSATDAKSLLNEQEE